jgi:putative Holliday junction resolvase
VSISDYNKVISFPLDTIDTSTLIKFLEDLIPNENIEKVIIGKPLNLNNQLHELENDILQFIELLQSIFPKITIERIDERYTSKISSFIIRQSGVNKKSRMNKSIIDKISASLILESYLIMNKK